MRPDTPSPDASPTAPMQPETRARPRPPRRRGLLSAGALLCAGGVAGFLLGRAEPGAEARRATVSPYQKLAVFARVLSYIETEYVDEVNRDLVIEEAIRGLLRRLDPHTQFFSAAQMTQLRSTLTGRYSGVGLNLSRRQGRVVVQSAEVGSPAARAGIRAGDVLLSVDSKDVRPLDLAAITALLRGQRGTRVTLELQPTGGGARQRLTLLRDALRSLDVGVAALPGGIGYVALRRFSHGVTRQVRQALGRLRQGHGGRLRGLVLDLRDNPGGLMDEGIRLADLFLAKGLIVRKVGKRGRLQEQELAHRKGTEERLPLVVLINRGTASAAEIVAAGLADHHRAILVGERSFGKGSMQSIIPLPDGSRLKLTIARYFRPSGKPIDGRGVAPRHVVTASGRGPELPPEGALSPSDRPLTAPAALPAWVKADAALHRAVGLLSPASPARTSL